MTQLPVHKAPTQSQALAKLGLARPNDNFRRVAAIGFGIIFFTFGVLGVWAAVAPLDSAVVAHGVLSIDSSRKTVQHLEGGILRKILVAEGDQVKAGQVLFEMDQTVPHANFDIARNNLYSLVAQEARLIAERDNAPSIAFPAEVTGSTDPLAARAIADETKQFVERRNTLSGQVGILKSRIDQTKSSIEGVDREKASMVEQVGYLTDEISGLQSLYDKGLVPKPRLLAVQRERAQLQGGIGRAIAEHAKAEKEISESSLQIRQLQQQMYQEVSKELADVRGKIADTRERFAVAQDTVHRSVVVSPSTGTVQNLRFFTVGAVVRAGEPMIDVVPSNEDLVVKANFSPNDVDNIKVGMKTEVRFPSFHSRTMPVLNGVVRTISRDRMIDEATHAPFFLAIVKVDESNLPKHFKDRMTAGLPSEVVVPTGERTVFQYIWEPLTNALRVSGREE
ncbi:MAG: HlyD family type I secretion periplasmic adaptor subunit [Caulobacteraceae bacterium]